MKIERLWLLSVLIGINIGATFRLVYSIADLKEKIQQLNNKNCK